MTRSALRVGAATAAVTITVLGMAPAFAAPLSTADATAVSGSIAGNPTDSGVVSAVDDGTGEQRTGAASPPVGVLGNQGLLNIGVLAQEATARVTDGAGSSAACAGIAGNGGSVAQVGSSRCLTPGAPVGVSVANLDLTGSVLVDPTSALEPLSALQPVMDQVVGPVTRAVSAGLAPLGQTVLGGSLGAVEARCTATPGAADGTASIVDGRLTVSLAGTQVDVLDLPVDPPPNTELLVDLDTVATSVLDGVRKNLDTALDGNLAPLNAAIDPVQQEVVDNVLAQLAPQLAPLNDDVLRVVLNKQTRTADSIQVTALSVEVLPAARELTGFPLGAVEIGRVSCGPNGQAVEQAAPPARVQKPRPQPRLPKMPTVVASGVAGEEKPWYDGLLAPAGLVLLAATGGLVGYRRSTGQ